MGLQTLTLQECRLQPVHDLPLLRRQTVRILRINRREIGIKKPVSFSLQLDLSLFVINLIQQEPVFHIEIFPLLYQLSFQLKLNNCDGLVDPHIQIHLLHPVLVRASRLDPEKLAGVILIGFQRKGCQRQHIDAVAVLQNVQIAVAGRKAYDRGYTGERPCRGAHPDNVVVAPGNVHRMVAHQPVHNFVRTGSPVVNISQDVKMVYDHGLDQITERRNERLRASDLDNGIDNRIIIGFLVQNLRFFCDQFLDDIGKIPWKSLADLGSGVFGGSSLAHLDQTVKRDLIPVVKILFRFPDQVHFLGRIIDKCSQGVFVRLRERSPEYLVNFLLHRSGTVFQHVGKSLVLSVHIRQEMFRPLRQIQNRRQIDDLRGSLRNRRIQLRQTLQIPQLHILFLHSVLPVLSL